MSILQIDIYINVSAEHSNLKSSIKTCVYFELANHWTFRHSRSAKINLTALSIILKSWIHHLAHHCLNLRKHIHINFFHSGMLFIFHFHTLLTLVLMLMTASKFLLVLIFSFIVKCLNMLSPNRKLTVRENIAQKLARMRVTVRITRTGAFV